MELTKKQRNDVFNAIVKGTLDPAECEIKSLLSSMFAVVHPATGSTFVVTENSAVEDSYKILSKVGGDPHQHAGYCNWGVVLRYISDWAKQVVEWRETPDLWATRHDWKSFVNLQEEASTNTLFTSEERETISSQLEAIKEAVKKTYELTAAQEAKIDEHFKEAEQASERLGRKDWTFLFGGTVLSLVLADVITPDIFHHILMMAAHGLGHLFIGGRPSVRGVLSE